MARKKKIIKTDEASNSLSKALEAGQDIKGLQGFISIEHPNENEDSGPDEVYIKVRCEGLRTEGCGVKVACSIVSGMGTLLISPCQFIDSPQEVGERRQRERRFANAVRDFKEIGKLYYVRQRRKAIADYVLNHLTENEGKDFYEGLSEEAGGTTFEKAPSHVLRKYAAIACMIANDVKNGDPDDFTFKHNWN